MENFYLVNDKIHVAILSYKRAGNITTHEIMPFAHIWVPESQGDEYRKWYGDECVVTIPDELDGSLVRKKNAVMDRTPLPWLVMVDDDITSISMWEGGEHLKLAPEDIAWMMTEGFTLANDLGVRLWGINQVNDAMAYRTMTPFSLLSAILGPFNGHLLPDPIRYDESCLLKEDYDFFLQHIQRYHKTFRLNKYHYIHDGGHKPGGVVSYRTMEKEKKDVARMFQKWGDVYSSGGSKGGAHNTGKNILNSVVRVPIAGC